jgi:hypothetical protein
LPSRCAHDRHKDGSIKAKGTTSNDVLTEYWEWLRKDGTKMRSGYFENGTGRRKTTYDAREKWSKSHQDEISPLSRPLPSPKAKAPPGDGAGLS